MAGNRSSCWMGIKFNCVKKWSLRISKNAASFVPLVDVRYYFLSNMVWQATFDVITSWPFMRPSRKTGGKSLYALVPFWSWNTLQHYLVDVMMKQKSFFVQGNLNFALMYRNNIEFSVFVLCHWVDCEIYWEYRTAGHLVFWKPWPVTGHIATACLF